MAGRPFDLQTQRPAYASQPSTADFRLRSVNFSTQILELAFEKRAGKWYNVFGSRERRERHYAGINSETRACA